MTTPQLEPVLKALTVAALKSALTKDEAAQVELELMKDDAAAKPALELTKPKTALKPAPQIELELPKAALKPAPKPAPQPKPALTLAEPAPKPALTGLKPGGGKAISSAWAADKTSSLKRELEKASLEPSPSLTKDKSREMPAAAPKTEAPKPKTDAPKPKTAAPKPKTDAVIFEKPEGYDYVADVK